MSELLRREIIAAARAELDARKPVQRARTSARDFADVAERVGCADAVFDPYGGAG